MKSLIVLLLLLLLLLAGCSVKPSASCSVKIDDKTIQGAKDSCIKSTTVQIKKEF